MLIQTDRGLISIEAEYQSAERCVMDGYSYHFHDSRYGDIYSKCLDTAGLYHSFALIVGYK